MSLTIRMLGEYLLLDDGVPVPIAGKPRFQLLIAYLILHQNRNLLRAQVAYDMWPDTSERQALTNLRNLLFRLQQSIPLMKQCLQIDQTHIRWQPQIESHVDVLELQRFMDEANGESDPQRQIDLYAAAVDQYRGNLLPTLYEEWVLIQQERYHDLCAQALQRLVELLESRQNYDAALVYAKQLVAHDPHYDRNHYQLIRQHMAVRDRAAALHAFHNCEAILQRELGIPPSEEILALYDQLLAGETVDLGLTARSAAMQRASSAKTGPVVVQHAIPMVGRHAEWQQLINIYQQLSTDHPHLTLISGVAGIGKTRLAEEFIHWASLQNITTAVAHCYVAQRQTAYAPLVAWLRSDAISKGLSTLAPVWLNEISRLLPEVLEQFPDLPGHTSMHESWQRLRLFEAIARAVLTAPEPIVLLLDDIQWVDMETLEWLQFFFNFAAQSQVLVIATQRLEEVVAGHPAMVWQHELTRRGRAAEFVLEGLPEAEVQQLSESLLGAPLDRETSRQIVTVTEGNPLFIAEMARARLEQGETVASASWEGLTTTIQATIAYRLDQISPKTRQLIDLAAVIGREFTFALLDEASNGDQSALAWALDEAWRKHVVREQGALTYDFSHDLIRVAAYNLMSATQRQMTHRRVAQALLALSDAAGQQEAGQLAGQIAAHFERGTMPAKAVEHYRRAAKLAQDSYANAEATEYYRHLLDSALSTQLSDAEQYDIRLELCAINRILGDWDEALNGYQAILEEAAAQGNALYQARAQRGIANIVRLRGEYSEALTWLTAAVENFEAVNDTAGMARSLWTMGEVYWYMGRYADAMEALQRQLDLAREHDYPREICDATGTMGIVTWSMGQLEKSEQHCLQSVELAREIGYRLAEGRALITIGNVYASRKEIVEAVAWYSKTLDVAQEIDDLQCVGWAVANLGIIYLNRREFKAAQACVEYSVAQSVVMGDWWSATLGMAENARFAAVQCNWANANDHYRVAIAMGEKLGTPYLSECYNQCVQTLLLQDRIAEANSVHQKAIGELSRTEGQFAGGEDVSFTASLNTVKLNLALETLSVKDAVHQLEALLERYAEIEQKARIHHTIWQLDRSQETHRRQAIDLCEKHYADNQDLALFDVYHDLTRIALPALDPLPKPPGELLSLPLSMDEVFQRIDRWLSE